MEKWPFISIIVFVEDNIKIIQDNIILLETVIINLNNVKDFFESLLSLYNKGINFLHSSLSSSLTSISVNEVIHKGNAVKIKL